MKRYLVAGFLMVMPSLGAAVPLPPGGAVGFDYYDARIAAGDSTFLGTTIATGSQNVRRDRDGFDGFDVIEDLYSASASFDWEVIRSGSGRTVFKYDLFGINAGAGISGAGSYNFGGFAGYDVEFGFASDLADGALLAPPVTRSADGDVITIDPSFVLGVLDEGPGGFESFYLSTDADGFRLASDTASAQVVLETFGVETLFFVAAPTPAAIPVPASIVALLSGLAGLTMLRRRKRTG